MKPPLKKRKQGVILNAYVGGAPTTSLPQFPGARTANSSVFPQSFSKVLHTHRVHQWKIGVNGTVARHCSSMVVPPSHVEIAHGNWYSSLFLRSHVTRQPLGDTRFSTQYDDLDFTTEYDPVIDEQVVVPTKSNQVSFFPTICYMY